MAKVNFKRVFEASKVALKAHSPEVLTGIGIVGFVTTIVLAVKATPKALDAIEERKDELNYGAHERLPVKEIVKSCWKCYTPAALLAAASTGCVIGGVSTSLRRTAAMATIAKVAETTLQEYSQKVVEEIGEEKEQKIKNEAKKSAVEKIEAARKSKHLDNETRLYCDGYLKHEFYATPVEIERAFGELNRIKDLYEYFSLNDFYSCLRSDTCPAGEDLGWCAADGAITYTTTDSTITYDGRPALVIDFNISPHAGYRDNF